MPPRGDHEELGSLQEARDRLYSPKDLEPISAPAYRGDAEPDVPHAWEQLPIQKAIATRGHTHVRAALYFFGAAVLFFLIALAAAIYLFYFGRNSVSVNNVTVSLQGPASITAGAKVPLSLAITNLNSIPIEDATVTIEFPAGTRSTTDPFKDYPRYTENLGTIENGATLTRSIPVIMYGAAGQAYSLPVHLSYGAQGTNATFEKTDSYEVVITSTPLSVSVDALGETVSGAPLTFSITVRSNSTSILQNVVLSPGFPFGFVVTSASIPKSGSGYLLGTLAPGASKTITLQGTLTGLDREERVFHFTVGTAKTANDPAVAVPYMTLDHSVTIMAPFIQTKLAIDGNTSATTVIAPGTHHTANLTYTNTLATPVTNAIVTVAISGSAVDYNSIQTSAGFYRSSDHTIVFSRDTDPSLSSLGPRASGIGSFSFSTLPTSSATRDPQITFTISVSGTRVGQSNVPEQVSASVVQTAKVATAVAVSVDTLHNSGPFANTGPFPPKPNEATTYTIRWTAQNSGSSIAGASAFATLPSYVTYLNQTAGTGSFSYDESARMVTWIAGDLPQNTTAQGAFQVSFTPSTSQSGSTPALTSPLSFSGYDRFAGVQVNATADAATIQTSGDPGFNYQFGRVQ